MLIARHWTGRRTAVSVLHKVSSASLNELPDEFVLVGVVEGHENLGILADLTHHVLQRHKQSKGWRGGKLGLSTQIQILPLRLEGVLERETFTDLEHFYSLPTPDSRSWENNFYICF